MQKIWPWLTIPVLVSWNITMAQYTFLGIVFPALIKIIAFSNLMQNRKLIIYGLLFFLTLQDVFTGYIAGTGAVSMLIAAILLYLLLKRDNTDKTEPIVLFIFFITIWNVITMVIININPQNKVEFTMCVLKTIIETAVFGIYSAVDKKTLLKKH